MRQIFCAVQLMLGLLGLAWAQNNAGQRVEVNGVQIYYQSVGSGEPMLLIHGYPLNGDLFRDNRQALARAGYRVITPDLRGFGRSGVSASQPGSIATYAQDMLGLMDRLDIQQAIIGGMSMGGPIVFEMYRQAPQRFRGMILINTIANPASLVEKGLWSGAANEAQTHGAKALVDDLMKDMLTYQSRSNRPELVSHLESLMKQASVQGDVAGANALAGRPDSLPTLDTIEVPTLIIAGQRDTVYPPVFSQKMQQNIPGSKLVVIPGASHAAIIEAAPQANQAMLSWLRSLPRASAQTEMAGQSSSVQLQPVALNMAQQPPAPRQPQTPAPQQTPPPTSAKANLINAQGQIVGSASFSQAAEGVRIRVEVSGLPAGQRGMHIHASGECAPGPDPEKNAVVPFGAAGSHFDPMNSRNHGQPNQPASQTHAGDLPNLSVGADGRATAEFTTNKLSVTPGMNSLLDRSLVIHANTDDYQTDPAGNSGDRLVCGVVQADTSKVQVRTPLMGSNVFPEGIAYNPQTQMAYTGSSTDGTLYRIHANGQSEMLALGGSPGRSAALGIKFAQDRLWIAGGASGKVAVVNAENGATLRILNSPMEAQPFINDLVVAGEWVYITDSFRPILFRVRVNAPDQPGVENLESWLRFDTTPLRYQPGINLNGIVATPDGRYLLSIQSNTGQLWRIGIADRQVSEVNLGTTRLQNGDGLVLSGRDVYVVRNAQSEVVKLTLAADYSSGSVASRLSDPSFRFPTTAALVGERLWVVNAQLDKQRNPPPVLPFTVVAVPKF